MKKWIIGVIAFITLLAIGLIIAFSYKAKVMAEAKESFDIFRKAIESMNTGDYGQAIENCDKVIYSKEVCFANIYASRLRNNQSIDKNICGKIDASKDKQYPFLKINYYEDRKMQASFTLKYNIDKGYINKISNLRQNCLIASCADDSLCKCIEQNKYAGQAKIPDTIIIFFNRNTSFAECKYILGSENLFDTAKLKEEEELCWRGIWAKVPPEEAIEVQCGLMNKYAEISRVTRPF